MDKIGFSLVGTACVALLAMSSAFAQQAQTQRVVGNRSELKPGAAIAIFSAVKKSDGTLEANRVNVGRDGVVPN